MTLGLFEKRIEGDDSLMQLARLRFQQCGMGAEMYASSLEQLDWTMRFRAAGDAPVMVHLSRGTNLADAEGRRQIENFARRYAGWIHGLIIHDHQKLADNFSDYVHAAHEMNSQLRQIEKCPWLFVEYAAGVEIETFVKFFEAIRGLDRISACVDIGHVGIHQTREAYAQIHPGVDVCMLKTRPALLPELMPDIEKAVSAALPTVLDVSQQLGTIGKPIHFHLQDGHPLSTFSPFGVSDHLSFLAKIPLSFEHRGQRHADLMFGPKGLSQIVTAALRAFAGAQLLFTLEIHPQFNQLPLGDAAHLFNHWQDKTNAEKMNAWLAMLRENHRLLRDVINAALFSEKSSAS